MLEDPSRGMVIKTFSQPLSVPAGAMARMRNGTQPSYPLKESGFAVTVGEAIAEEMNVNLIFFSV